MIINRHIKIYHIHINERCNFMIVENQGYWWALLKNSTPRRDIYLQGICNKEAIRVMQ